MGGQTRWQAPGKQDVKGGGREHQGPGSYHCIAVPNVPNVVLHKDIEETVLSHEIPAQATTIHCFIQILLCPLNGTSAKQHFIYIGKATPIYFRLFSPLFITNEALIQWKQATAFPLTLTQWYFHFRLHVSCKFSNFCSFLTKFHFCKMHFTVRALRLSPSSLLKILKILGSFSCLNETFTLLKGS
jgi:hypothetical protein